MSAIFSSRFRLMPRRFRHAGSIQFADWTSANSRDPAARRLDGNHKVSTPAPPPPQLSPSLASNSESIDRRRGREVGCNVHTENESNKSTASTATKTSTTQWKPAKGKVSAVELKRLVKEYGPIAVGFHFSVFLTTLGGFYSFIDYGLDVASVVKNLPFIADNLPHPSAGNLALAWGMTTVTGPFRGVMTVTLTPRVAKFWRGREANRKLKSAPKQEGGKDAR